MKCGTWLRRPTTLVSILFLFYADVLLSNKHICLLHKQSSKEVVLFSLSGWLLFGKVVLSFLHIVGLLLWNRSAVFGKYLLAQVAACLRTEMGMGGISAAHLWTQGCTSSAVEATEVAASLCFFSFHFRFYLISLEDTKAPFMSARWITLAGLSVYPSSPPRQTTVLLCQVTKLSVHFRPP